MTTAIVVGSGPTGLAAAVTLAAAGVEVTVYEASSTPGGGARSVEATVEGLVHDECSGFHPFAVDSAFSREAGLAPYGLEWAWAPIEFAHPLEGGAGASVVRSVSATAASLGNDRVAYKRLIAPIVDQFGDISTEFLQPIGHLPRHPWALGKLGLRALPPASVLARTLRTEEGRGLWAGAAAHAFGSFRAPLSSAIGVALTAAAHARGWPVAVGGTGAITSALVSRLEDLGGKVLTDVPVYDIRDLGAADVVMLDTSPSGAVAAARHVLPKRTIDAYERFRHGPAAFQLALAVDGGIPWAYAKARQAGTVHVGGTFAQIAAAEEDVVRGRMPEQPFVLVGQQAVADPSRARGSVVPIDCYAHVPAGYTGDATEQILSQIERFAPGFRDRVLAITARPTFAIASENRNFVGGDIVTGAKSPRQVLFGPRLALNPYATGAPGVYLCSAAVPPGPGAHGLCGHLAAKSALKRLR
ncbi:MAG: phytoene desaturase family protein [Marmoricola sp.]